MKYPHPQYDVIISVLTFRISFSFFIPLFHANWISYLFNSQQLIVPSIRILYVFTQEQHKWMICFPFAFLLSHFEFILVYLTCVLR